MKICETDLMYPENSSLNPLYHGNPRFNISVVIELRVVRWSTVSTHLNESYRKLF
jgi:hypothetical protein